MESFRYTDTVREDFDRLAVLSGGDGWDHNAHYHPFLLKQLRGRTAEALEVGCGTGSFARDLAQRCDRVVGLDLSPRTVEVARTRSEGHPNVQYLVADAASWGFPEERFDCVASIATLHHLPLRPMLAKMRGALRAGGTLLLLDLYRASGVTDYLVGALGFPTSKALRLAETGSFFGERQSPEVRRAWEDHSRTDVLSTLDEVRRACATELPGAIVRRHLLWRYSVVWRKPVR